MNPIKKYIELLNKVSTGIHPLEEFSKANTLGLPKSEEVSSMLQRLRDDGLVYIYENKINTSNKIMITPKGSLALLEWTEKVEEKSFFHQIKGSAINFAWLVVGALLTYIVKTNS